MHEVTVLFYNGSATWLERGHKRSITVVVKPLLRCNKVHQREKRQKVVIEVRASLNHGTTAVVNGICKYLPRVFFSVSIDVMVPYGVWSVPRAASGDSF